MAFCSQALPTQQTLSNLEEPFVINAGILLSNTGIEALKERQRQSSDLLREVSPLPLGLACMGPNPTCFCLYFWSLGCEDRR